MLNTVTEPRSWGYSMGTTLCCAMQMVRLDNHNISSNLKNLYVLFPLAQFLGIFCHLPHTEGFLPLGFMFLPPSPHSNTTKEGSLPNYSEVCCYLNLFYRVFTGHFTISTLLITAGLLFWTCNITHLQSPPSGLQDSFTVKLLAENSPPVLRRTSLKRTKKPRHESSFIHKNHRPSYFEIQQSLLSPVIITLTS